MASYYSAALAELAAACAEIDDAAVDEAVRRIAGARTVIVFGCGRERLQIMGLAMRLFHMGRAVAVVGDMTTPAAGPGDLLIACAGPGELSTASALLGVAREAGARTLVITAQPSGASCRFADFVLTIPAQTMADDRGQRTAVLPMGSAFEGALFVVFEVMVLKLKALLGISAEDMRARHTNLE